jgi:septum site-determining protein MinD
MTGQVFTVAGGKGGVGKTTTTANLCAALAAAGYDAVAVDGDLAMANLAQLLDVDGGPTVHDVLAGTADIEETIAEHERGFDVVPGTRDLEAFADADPARLRDAVVAPLVERYDAVVLDTSAGLSHEVTVPLGLADAVVLVTTPNVVAIKDAAKTGELAERVDGEIAGVVVTRTRDDEATRQVLEELGDRVLAAVPETDAIATLDVLAPAGGGAARAYSELAARLLGIDRLPETDGVYAVPDPEPDPLAEDLEPAVTAATGTASASASEPEPADADAQTEATADADVGTEATAEEPAAGASATGTDPDSDAGSGSGTEADAQVEAATDDAPAATSSFDPDRERGGSFIDTGDEEDEEDEEREGALGRLRDVFD